MLAGRREKIYKYISEGWEMQGRCDIEYATKMRQKCKQ